MANLPNDADAWHAVHLRPERYACKTRCGCTAVLSDSPSCMQVALTAMQQASTVAEATAVFSALQRLCLNANVEVFNALIGAHAKAAQWQQALHVFRQMGERRVAANTQTYNLLLQACVRGAALRRLRCHLSVSIMMRPDDGVDGSPLLTWCPSHNMRQSIRVSAVGRGCYESRQLTVSVQRAAVAEAPYCM